MIKIQKKDPPKILIDNQEKWKNNLLKVIEYYDGYKNIPITDKTNLLSHYKHKDIQNALFESSHNKCAFCECKPGESSNIEVEHFAPKSIYPELTFEWDNLLPSCRKCNEAKLDFDTQTYPIINPAKEDPEKLLTYFMLRIIPLKGSEEEKAQNTIDACNLNCERLYNARANLMKTMIEYFDDLKDIIVQIKEADTQQKKNRRITKLSNSIDKINAMLKDDHVFSGFLKWMVMQYPEYEEAKQIIANR